MSILEVRSGMVSEVASEIGPENSMDLNWERPVIELIKWDNLLKVSLVIRRVILFPLFSLTLSEIAHNHVPTL